MTCPRRKTSSPPSATRAGFSPLPVLRERVRCRSRRGLALIECAISIVIVGVLVVSALRATGAVARGRLVQKDRAPAMALARQLLSEIAQRAYADPGASPVFGPEPAKPRAAYDDVDDYHGLNESPPNDSTGTAISGFTGWRQQVAVEYVNPSSLGVVGSDSGVEKITVTITSPAGLVTTLAALRSSAGPGDKTIVSQTTFISRSTVTLQVGADARTRVVSGTDDLNQLP